MESKNTRQDEKGVAGMNGEMFDNTKVAAYYLWDKTGCDSALALWYCAEEIACYFEQMGILSIPMLDAIRRKGIYSVAYIDFVRQIAFRIYVYTNQFNSDKNWYTAEQLLSKSDWNESVVSMANVYRSEKSNRHFLNDVRSSNVRNFYDGQTFHSS